ncbi:MAG: bifunctional 4-hydroxy-3-methylbut-2-enyl diphosphate reductase/30S ribosomal protein S1 [Turicibacter sp.]|nr:bifunctional 4-hydroxy-3-methylbut-2-enyl diphosphate reductase/30S ribosomal protein S1 [Turicibacter sp.]
MLVVAEHMGFCAGVARAVRMAYETGKNKDCVTLGALIHNREVIADLEKNGVRIINSLDEWKQGQTVIIRAHGIPLSLEEEIKQRNIPYIDMTCPHVKIIHHHAAEASKNGRTLIVLGQKEHPEVVGICGYAGEDTIVAEDFHDGFDKNGKSYTLVVQTTFNKAIFDEIKERLCASGIDLIVHDTICNATALRQAEAERVSKIVDCMIILGDKNSANTKKLFEISRKNCPNTMLVQNICEIFNKDLQFLPEGARIGLTAGASTPPMVTKEALLFMSSLETSKIEENKNEQDNNPMENQSFEEMLNENLVTLRNGDIVNGTVIQVTPNEITVNLGYKSDGLMEKREFTDDINADLTQLISVGESIEVLIVRVNDGDGNVLVSKRRLDAQANYRVIERAFKDKEVLPGRITELVKGGFIVNIFGNKVFVPASQISDRFVEDLNALKGKEMNFNILEFDRSKRRIVGGRRELAKREQKELRDKVFANLEVGQKVEGVVCRITNFGAFVDLGGIDGLLHISELAWRRVRAVSEVLSVGDSVTATVVELDKDKGKISLSLKDVNDNPWSDVEERYPIGALVRGKVVRLTSFGAFVNLEDGIDGLVHVSQISIKHIEKPAEELKLGQIITVKVTEVDQNNKRISLSKKVADLELAGETIEYISETSAEEGSNEGTNETPEESNEVAEVANETPKSEIASEETAEANAEEPEEPGSEQLSL